MSKGKRFLTREEMLEELGWLKRWLVRQSRSVQILFLIIVGSLFGVDMVIPDFVPLIDEAVLGWLSWTSFKVTVDEGPRYRKLGTPEHTPAQVIDAT
tara:strand:+ start:111 stop:401 length:291 start_codon:yes stop_codon:yes gene_type:complete